MNFLDSSGLWTINSNRTLYFKLPILHRPWYWSSSLGRTRGDTSPLRCDVSPLLTSGNRFRSHLLPPEINHPLLRPLDPNKWVVVCEESWTIHSPHTTDEPDGTTRTVSVGDESRSRLTDLPWGDTSYTSKNSYSQCVRPFTKFFFWDHWTPPLPTYLLHPDSDVPPFPSGLLYLYTSTPPLPS